MPDGDPSIAWIRRFRPRKWREPVLKAADLDREKQQAEADDPRPLRDVPAHVDDSKVREEGDHIQNQTDDPGNLFGGFSSASCHEVLLTTRRLYITNGRPGLEPFSGTCRPVPRNETLSFRTTS